MQFTSDGFGSIQTNRGFVYTRKITKLRACLFVILVKPASGEWWCVREQSRTMRPTTGNT